jgi:hypothetical protein
VVSYYELKFKFEQQNAMEKWCKPVAIPEEFPKLDIDMFKIRILVDDLEEIFRVDTPALAFQPDEAVKGQWKNQRVVSLFDGRLKVFVTDLDNEGWEHVHDYTAKFRYQFLRVLRDDCGLRAMHPFHYDASGANIMASRPSCISIKHAMYALKKIGHDSLVIQQFGQKRSYDPTDKWFRTLDELSYNYFKREVEADRPVEPNYYDIACERSDPCKPEIHQFYWGKKDIKDNRSYRHKSVFRSFAPDHALQAGWIRYNTEDGTIKRRMSSKKGPLHGTL